MKVKNISGAPLFIAGGAVYPYSEELLESGFRKTRFNDEYNMFRVFGTGEHKKLIVPRNMASAGGNDLRTDGSKVKFDSKFKPRNSEQSRVIAEAVGLLTKNINFMLEAPTGFGKGASAMDIIAKIGVKTIVIVTKEDIRDQWIEEAKKTLGLELGKGIGLIQGDVCNVVGQKIVIAMVHSLAKEDRYPESVFKEFGLMVVDECFPTGTMVDGRLIETLKVGDKVRSFNHLTNTLEWKTITRITRKKTTSLSKLKGKNFEFYSTRNHPVFVNGEGYTRADRVSVGESVLRLLPHSDTQTPDEAAKGQHHPEGEVVLPRIKLRSEGESIGLESQHDFGEQDLRLRADEEKQPVISTGSAREDIELQQRKAEAKPDRWKRTTSFCTSTNSVQSTGTPQPNDGTRYSDQEASKFGISDSLQNRHCNPVEVSSYRGGRTEPQYHEGKGARFEENDVFGVERVDCVTVLESGRDREFERVCGDGYVYNLEVADNHNFFANGVLVHNCHRIAADFFSQACYRVPCKKRIGISATPDRKDGREEVLYAHLGKVLVKSVVAPLTPKVLMRSSPWTVPMTTLQDKSGKTFVGPVPHTPGKCGHIINMLAKHFPRNKVFSKFIFAAYKKDRVILVQSDRKEHLETMVAMITAEGVPMAHIGYYVGGMDKGGRDLAKTKRVIMATYQMTAEATDIPWADTLVMMTPKSDVRQIVGRIRRAHPGKKDPLVFDVVDQSSKVFAGYWKTRQEWYKSEDILVEM